MYSKLISDHVIYLVLYVDDMLLIGNNKEIIQNVKTQLSSKFDMKDLLAANSIFLIFPKSFLHPICLLKTNHCRIFATRLLFYSCDNYNSISIHFSQLKVWKPIYRYLDCRSLLLIPWKTLYHWFITWLQRLFQTMSISFWLRKSIYKPLSMKIYWLHLVL